MDNFIGRKSNLWERQEGALKGIKYCACNKVATRTAHDGEGGLADVCADCGKDQDQKDQDEIKISHL